MINPLSQMYEFPILYKATEAHSKIRMWSLFVRLITRASCLQKYPIGWNLFEEHPVEFSPSYLNQTEALLDDDGIIAQFWTETGEEGGKIIRHPPTLVLNSKQKTFRNIAQQAVFEAESLYNSKLRDGFRPPDQEEYVFLNVHPSGMIIDRYFPMLAWDSKKTKALGYPHLIQPKLDGDRCLATPTELGIQLYSRQRLDYPDNPVNLQIKEYLKPAFRNFTGILDGEFYRHGMRHQDIHSMATNGQTPITEQHHQYHLYDLFFPDNLSIPFQERHTLLKQLYSKLSPSAQQYIKLVETHWAEDEKQQQYHYNTFLAQGYEGAILRDPEGHYKTHKTNRDSLLRSAGLLKLKPINETEYKVVGYKAGKKGKMTQCIIWICETPTGETFKVTQNAPIEEQERLFQECEKNFAGTYKGRMMKVKYESITARGIPKFAKSLGFRDFK